MIRALALHAAGVPLLFTGLGTDLARVRWRNFKHLLRSWWPGALRRALGLGLLALGGYLINL